MSANVKTTRSARSRTSGPQLRIAEADYNQAIRTFGVDSAEAKVAWMYWCALRRQVRS